MTSPPFQPFLFESEKIQRKNSMWCNRWMGRGNSNTPSEESREEEGANCFDTDERLALGRGWLERMRTFKRQNSERRIHLESTQPYPSERRVASLAGDHWRALSVQRTKSPSPFTAPNLGSSTPNLGGYGPNHNQNGVSDSLQDEMEEPMNEHWQEQLQLAAESRQASSPHHYARPSTPEVRGCANENRALPSESGEKSEMSAPEEAEQGSLGEPDHQLRRLEPQRDGDNEDMLENELDQKWILNLSMHFRDKSNREKFFVTYAETPNRWRRVTVSCDYRNAPPDSLERDLNELRFQRDKSARIYESIRESLPEIQFYPTVTNLKLETSDGRLHVHVTEDVNEIIPYPSLSSFRHLDTPAHMGGRDMYIRESDLEFDAHLSGFVYKVRHDKNVYIKKEIPGPDTVDEFLYEINALHALSDSESMIKFEGLIVDDNEEFVKGLLVSYTERGALVDLFYDFKRELFTRQGPGEGLPTDDPTHINPIDSSDLQSESSCSYIVGYGQQRLPTNAAHLEHPHRGRRNSRSEDQSSMTDGDSEPQGIGISPAHGQDYEEINIDGTPLVQRDTINSDDFRILEAHEPGSCIDERGPVSLRFDIHVLRFPRGTIKWPASFFTQSAYSHLHLLPAVSAIAQTMSRFGRLLPNLFLNTLVVSTLATSASALPLDQSLIADGTNVEWPMGTGIPSFDGWPFIFVGLVTILAVFGLGLKIGLPLALGVAMGFVDVVWITIKEDPTTSRYVHWTTFIECCVFTLSFATVQFRKYKMGQFYGVVITFSAAGLNYLATHGTSSNRNQPTQVASSAQYILPCFGIALLYWSYHASLSRPTPNPQHRALPL